ncbi:MFS transporter [Tepiditoga spiralis]|uniref:MFS transporter n=1 Tax=Tepiditoga spiralis TaxID=2108365 RepID=A0A7G1GC64_9BACT|nr:MFS transporter [Tepiditoga spiralis]BBE31819.1 MFS transporter [Tepiditoga spiralis]
MEVQRFKKNIKVYVLFRFFISMLIIGPILTPYMLFKGLNYSQIMLLQSIAAISVFVFEVPTGAIADKISRKVSLVMSGFFIALGTLFYIVFSSFYLFAIAEILFGIGLTFASGADSAILYESLDKLGRKKDYQYFEGHASFYIFIGQAFGSILSGFLYKINPYAPWWISIVNVLIASLIAFSFTEPSKNKSKHKYLIHVFKSFNIAFKTPRILWAIVFSAIIGFTFKSSFWLYQPYFKSVNIDVMWYGVIFFFFNIIAVFSSKILVKRYYDKRPRKVLIRLLILLSITFILPAIFIFPFMVIVLSLQQILRGLYPPTLKFYINHQIKNEYRATVLSLVSLVANLSFAIFSPFVGMSLDSFGMKTTYIWMGTVTVGGILVLTKLRKIQKNKKILDK